MKTNTNNLEDFKVNIKIKLSALWASVMFLYIYGDYFSLYLPGEIKNLAGGTALIDSPLKLFAASLVMVIPSLMISLSLILKPKINRALNIIFGALYTGIMVLIAIASIDLWHTSYVFYAIVESFITSIIVWTAWTWSKH